MNQLAAMKASSTPAAKLYNWNLLSKEMEVGENNLENKHQH
jgi:hypothetical protein